MSIRLRVALVAAIAVALVGCSGQSAGDRYTAIAGKYNAVLAGVQADLESGNHDVRSAALVKLADAQHAFAVDVAAESWPTNAQGAAKALVQAVSDVEQADRAAAAAASAGDEPMMSAQWDRATNAANLMRITLGLPPAPDMTAQPSPSAT